MNKETFGAFIAQNRRERGMTQQKLADQLHVTDKAVSKWERGLCYPDLTLMEPLAAALELSVTELMTCRRQTEERTEEAGETGETAAVRSLLDISGNALRLQRRTIWAKATAVFLLALAVAAAALYFSTSVSELRHGTVAMKQSVDQDYYVYIEDGSHLIRLQCPDRKLYDEIHADGLTQYEIRCSWNRLTYRGSLEDCEPDEEWDNLGGMMDQAGASTDFGSVLGVDCVWQEYRNIYPDPEREGAWLFSIRLWYSGDGSDYFAEGEETTLLLVENCRGICADDFDSDGIAELFVLTRYEEEPCMLYELEDGELLRLFPAEIPQSVADFFRRDGLGL